MSPERFKLVEEVFQDAVGMEPVARRDFVADRCGGDRELCDRVLALLDQHDAGAIEPGAEFSLVVRGAAEAALRQWAPAAPPERIASYRILRPLGEGGFGTVYLAEQDHPRRTVAIKLLRPAFATGEMARRFEYEALILARLRHPGIAQIYEAGSAELRVIDAAGRDSVLRQPFLALEYVDGPNLVAFALGDNATRPALPVRDRLALFARVCDALHHAHQNGVIHRDLKPDNILVSCDRAGESSEEDSGSMDALQLAHPKVLDFGVARVMDGDPELTRAQTIAGRMIGTLAYMSPEQIAGDTDSIDTRSDIYAMGVLLHQLLSGSLPYDVRDVPLDEAIRIVREREPAPVRALDRSLRADAHAVTQKAMAKDRERRYPSMAELAADVRRLLSGEPVAAKAGSRWYVVGKSLRRHRLALGVAAAFVLLLGSSSVMGWMLYGSARRERRQSAVLLRESYVNEARATRAANGVGRRFVVTDSLKKAAALRMGDDLRTEAVAALCDSDFRTLREFPAEPGSARGQRRLDRLALIGDDRSIRVMSTESGGEICRIPARDVPPKRVRFNDTSEYLGAVYEEGGGTTIAVWSVGNAQPVLVRAVAIAHADFAFGASGGAAWAAVPQTGGALEIVALPSGKRIAEHAAGGDASLMAASPDGTRLALVASRGDKIEVRETLSGQTLGARASEVVLRSPSWSPDSRTIGACGGDSRIHLWDADTLERLPALEGHRAAVVELAMCGRLIASGGWDGTVRVWDARTRTEVIAPIPGAELLGFDGKRLVIAGEDAVRVLEFEDDSPRRVLHAAGPLGAEATIDFCVGAPVMAIAGSSGVQIWDTGTWRSAALTTHGARSVMLSPDGATVLALVGGELRSWDIRAAWESETGGASRTIWRGMADSWASLDSNGTSAIVSDRGQILRVDLASGAATRIATVPPRTERPIIDATGRWLFVGTWRGAPAEVIDLRTGTASVSFAESSVRGEFSRDGALLTVGLPGRHLVFDSGQWQSPREFQVHETGLPTVAGASTAAPDGALLAYVEPPHVVRLADPHTASVVATLPNTERFGIPDLRFSPDGRLLVVLTLEETVIVWQMDELRGALEKLGMGW